MSSGKAASRKSNRRKKAAEKADAEDEGLALLKEVNSQHDSM